MSLRGGRSPTRQPLRDCSHVKRLLRFARNDVSAIEDLRGPPRNDVAILDEIAALLAMTSLFLTKSLPSSQ
jgi:hypothetical protein